MKKKIILIALLSFWWKAQAQQKDSLQAIPLPDKTEVQALYSFYTQDGEHSAVTGGEGTEKLNVQAVSLKGKHRLTTRKTITWNAGCDFITSASTDNIDFVRSSASYKDQRVSGSIGFGYATRKETTFQLQAGASMESDYLSYPIKAAIVLPKKNKRQWIFSTDLAFDDLRWGRLNPDYKRPVTVVYPKELRYRQWYDTYRRFSATFNAALHLDINRKTNLSLYASAAIQEGLLITPFHRIYFSNDSVGVEQLPSERKKFAASGELRTFIGNTISKTSLGGYTDNFGINALNLEQELVRKIKPGVYLGPFIRGYAQTASIYFDRIRKHAFENEYYTSDNDLSAFISWQAGLTVDLYPVKRLLRFFPVNRVGWRASYYQRSDGLYYLSTSLLFTLK